MAQRSRLLAVQQRTAIACRVTVVKSSHRTSTIIATAILQKKKTETLYHGTAFLPSMPCSVHHAEAQRRLLLKQLSKHWQPADGSGQRSGWPPTEEVAKELTYR